MNSHTSLRLQVTWFDGHSPKARIATIWVFDGQLYVQPQVLQEQAAGSFGQAADKSLQTWPVSQVQWPERQRHGQRQALLPGGGVVMHEDATVWDEWARGSGLQESQTVRWMQSWRRVGVALVITVAIMATTWVWGVPWLVAQAVPLVPASVEEAMGQQAMQTIEDQWLKPSKLGMAEQEAIRERLARAVAAAAQAGMYGQEGESGEPPRYRLHFRESDDDGLGPNAFALPGGDVIITDSLVKMLADQPDAITGILAHELGHVRHRHGLRMLGQSAIVASASALVIGDFSSLLALVPTLLASSAYSRDFEREADMDARTTLRSANLSTRPMVVFFERVVALRKDRERSALAIAFSSHPADEERIAFFSD